MGKKSKPPPAPDYTALAEKTAASEKAAAEATTLANRPNQTDVYGNTSTWTKDPTTGQWSQVQSLGAEGQKLLAEQNAMRDQLSGQVTDALSHGYTTEGLPEYTNYDPSKLQGVDAEGLRAKAGLFNMDPMGNAQAIQDATYKLLLPQREQQRAAEIQRLKNQGLTEDSPGFQRAMATLGQGDTDAQLKALLAGQQEYGNQFQRAMGQNAQNFGQMSDAEKFAMALRGQQWGEQGDQAKLNMALREAGLNEQAFLRQQPLNEFEQLLRMQSLGDPRFGSFMGATGGGGVDYLGAGSKQADAEMARYNAKQAGKSGLTSGLFGLAGSVMGGPIGGMIGSKVGSMIG